MKKNILYKLPPLILSALTILIFTGCENSPTELEDYSPEPMLSAYLYNGEPVNDVHFQWTAKFGLYYDPEAQAITGAEIVIFPTDVADTAGTALYLTGDPAEAGHYITPAGVVWLPEGLREYRIVAQKPSEGINCTAATTVPDTFTVTLWHPILQPEGWEILPAYPDTLSMPGPLTRQTEEMYLEWTPSASAGGYFMNLICLTPKDSLVPLDPEWDPAEDELEPEELWRFAFVFAFDDQYDMTVPWLYFMWEGPHYIEFISGSSEYLDFAYAGWRIFNQGVSMDLPDNIDGGIGIFGGICRYRYELVMEKAGL